MGINIVVDENYCPKLETNEKEGVYINGNLLTGVLGYNIENCNPKETLTLHIRVNETYRSDRFIGVKID